jgi:hypothetical protein
MHDRDLRWLRGKKRASARRREFLADDGERDFVVREKFRVARALFHRV